MANAQQMPSDEKIVIVAAMAATIFANKDYGKFCPSSPWAWLEHASKYTNADDWQVTDSVFASEFIHAGGKL